MRVKIGDERLVKIKENGFQLSLNKSFEPVLLRNPIFQSRRGVGG